jgi:23S rRNA (guanosine2251-2'-O)-methyltransferase
MRREKQIIFGIHAVLEALESGKEIEKVFVKKGKGSEKFAEMLIKLRDQDVNVQVVPIEKINSLTRKNHQGVVGWLSEISYSDITMLLPGIYESGQVPLILVLDGVTDVRNFGAIARTAECAGVHALITPRKGSAMINAEAVKTSSGALHRMAVCRVDHLAKATKFLKDSGLQIIAASEKADQPYYEVNMRVPTAIVMGSEGRGISSELLSGSDQRISIPMKGAIGSLNVSVAAGILLFEVGRQRSTIIPTESGG